jgi:ATP-dependent exoDNAse (exonuclease V) beta subunit
MDDITVANPSGRSITFNEDKHRYTDDAGVIYRSCTKIIHELFPPFDADKIAVFSAKKRGISVEAIKAEWKEAGRVACDMGTRIHQYMEDRLTKGVTNVNPINEKEKNIIERAEEFIPKFHEKYEVVEAEKIVFCPDYKLAGMIDLIARDKNTGNLWVLDWKTNKEIVEKTKYKSYGYLFLSHLDDTNYWHYALQLNIYRTVLHHEKYFNMDNSSMGIFHLREDKVQAYQLPCLDKEVAGIFNYMTKS